MRLELMNFNINNNNSLVINHSANEILKCNDITLDYNLVLTREHALELVETRNMCLSANGRVEFGGGVIDKIIIEFCNSPYISGYNYVDTISRLLSIFYFYKNETMEMVTDDELISFMHKAFDGSCQGSLELLESRELDEMARNIRCGYAMDFDQDFSDEEDEDDDDDEDDWN